MEQRTKNILLVVGLLTILFLAYHYSFAKTFTLSDELQKLEGQKAEYESAPIQLASLAKREKQLNVVLTKNNIEGNSLQYNLLQTLNVLSDTSNVKVIAFQEPHRFTDEITKKSTATYDFTLRGDYKALIGVVYALEQQYSFGSVIQVGFEKKKNFRTGVNYLECRMLLQRVN